MRWVLMFVLTGCYGPSTIIGALCASPSAAERCPPGQTCVANGGEERCQLAAVIDASSDAGDDATDAPFDDAGVDAPVDACASCPNDPDGDGVIGNADNCPSVANVDQANEDGDTFGDRCDPCPPSATGNADSDGDGVGNGCDPSTGVETIAHFVGFHGGLPAGWAPVGTFTASGGDGVASAGAGQGALLVRPAPTSGVVTISAEVTFTAFVGSSLAGVGVIDRRRTGTDDESVNCQLVADSGSSAPLLRLYDSANNVFVNEAAHPLAINGRYILRITRETTGAHTCTASNPTATTTGTATFNPTGPELGVRVRSGSARYHWIMVVTRP